MAVEPLHSDLTPKSDTISSNILQGRSVTVAAPGADIFGTFGTAFVKSGDRLMATDAFACIRVRMVSTGWHARTDTPPDIQPAAKSIQASLDIMVCELEEMMCTTVTSSIKK